MDREQINKNLEMVSPLDDMLRTGIYVNVFGDSVVHFDNMPILMTESDAKQLVKDIEDIRMRITLGEELTYFEKLMLNQVAMWT